MKKKDFIYYSGKKYDGMMGRCYRTSDKSYKTYGSQGIRVCSEWIRNIESYRLWLLAELKKENISVEQFVKDASKMQVDRIDPKGHYTPENCRLSSPQLNMRNRSVSKGKLITSAEGETFTFGEKI